MKPTAKPRQKKAVAKEPFSHKKSYQSDDSSSNDDASLEDSQSEEEKNTSNFLHHRKHPKLTPFGDKEAWKVWYKRFKICTK